MSHMRSCELRCFQFNFTTGVARVRDTLKLQVRSARRQPHGSHLQLRLTSCHHGNASKTCEFDAIHCNVVDHDSLLSPLCAAE